VEIAGGYFGGIVGARAPDVFDPPTSPRHRDLGHGIVPVGLVVVALLRVLPAWQAELRTVADRHRNAAARSENRWTAAIHSLIELLCRFASGAVAGIVAGYVSHLALDAMTPAGLPIIAGRDVRLDI
jgi:membrane-bound metal-dependent hydrolase YbcI (DUF457 family)